MSKRFRTQPSPEVSRELRDAFNKDTPPGEADMIDENRRLDGLPPRAKAGECEHKGMFPQGRHGPTCEHGVPYKLHGTALTCTTCAPRDKAGQADDVLNPLKEANKQAAAKLQTLKRVAEKRGKAGEADKCSDCGRLTFSGLAHNCKAKNQRRHDAALRKAHDKSTEMIDEGFMIDKAGEADIMPTYSTSNPVGLVTYAEAGECEREWKWNKLYQEYHCRKPGCNERRTVADFWKREPPIDTLSLGSRPWYWIYEVYGDKTPKIERHSFYWRDCERGSVLYWHGPIETRNGRILPPPVPE